MNHWHHPFLLGDLALILLDTESAVLELLAPGNYFQAQLYVEGGLD